MASYGPEVTGQWLRRAATAIDGDVRLAKETQNAEMAADAATGDRVEVLALTQQFRELAQRMVGDGCDPLDVIRASLGFAMRMLLSNVSRADSLSWLSATAGIIREHDGGEQRANKGMLN